MKIAWLSLLIGGSLLAPVVARAQPITQPSDVAATPQHVGLGVEVLAPNAEIDAGEVRTAIATELGVDVTDGTAFAPSLGRLEILVDRGTIRVAYHPAAGTLIERTLALPIVAEERVQLIAFVAINLVRDQAGEILEGLRTPIVIPPAVAPVASPRPAPPVTRHLPATIGFVPPLSVDRAFGERVIVGTGLHALIGMTTGSQYASISGLVDIQREFASGVQIGGLVASAGRLEEGVQIGGLAAISRGDAEGVQIGGIVAGAKGKVTGAQIGGVAVASRHIYGAQIAGVASASKHVQGVQIGGVATIADRVHGVQIGGVANVGGDVRGVQIGAVNVAKRMRGVQIGIVNLSDDGDDAVPIGLINYARNGRLAAEGWVDSSRISAAAIRHGTKHVHNIWAVGWSPDYDHVLVGAGLGAHFALADGPNALGIDLDGMHWFTNVWDRDLSQISQLRASLAVPLGGFEVFAGAAANVYVSDEMDESASFHPVYERRTTTDGGKAVVAWPSAFAGIRLRAR
jgi:hypothetical protein